LLEGNGLSDALVDEFLRVPTDGVALRVDGHSGLIKLLAHPALLLGVFINDSLRRLGSMSDLVNAVLDHSQGVALVARGEFSKVAAQRLHDAARAAHRARHHLSVALHL